MRWAETTSASKVIPSSLSASPAAAITGQSESDPITIPTRGAPLAVRVLGSVIGVPFQVRRRVPGPGADVVEIAAVRRDVAHLAAGADLLAVQLDAQPSVAREAVQQRRRQVLDGAAQHVVHHRPGR